MPDPVTRLPDPSLGLFLKQSKSNNTRSLWHCKLPIPDWKPSSYKIPWISHGWEGHSFWGMGQLCLPSASWGLKSPLYFLHIFYSAFVGRESQDFGGNKSKEVFSGNNLSSFLVQFLSHVWLLCNPNDCSMPGSPVLHYLLEHAQTHVHQVIDAIQPSHPLSSPSPAFNLSQNQGLFQWVSSMQQVAKVLELQI